MPLDHLIEGLELEDIDNWGKDLGLDDGCVVSNLSDCRLNVVSRARQLVSTGQDPPALFLDLCDSFQVIVDSLLVVHGSHQGGTVHRISDGDGLVGLDHTLNKAVVN